MNILVISSHPDDETLGCGGTLLKHKADGADIYWMIVTRSFEPVWSPEIIKKKETELERAKEAYGIEKCINLGFHTTQLDTVPLSELIQTTHKAVSMAKPEIVYLPHGGDVHTDHQIVFTAAMSVLKPFYMTRLGVRRVLSYETLSSTEAAPPHIDRYFIPQVYNDISDTIEEKLEVFQFYETEIQLDPLPRSLSAIRSLARFRGATVGVPYAEAFMLNREIMKP